jgi:glucokinase
MPTLLAGDIGGTKTLLATYAVREGQLVQQRSARYASAAWGDFSAMVRHFLAEGAGAGGGAGEGAGEGGGQSDGDRPRQACFAVAGPVQNGQVQLTNLTWHLEAGALAKACDLEAVELVNDFAVLIHGLPHLSAEQQQPLRRNASPPTASTAMHGPVAVLGAGTGLGVAIGVPGPRGPIALASEAAHAAFAPREEQEWRLRQWLLNELELERVSIERVVSGTGLGHVARWMLRERDPGGSHPLHAPAEAWWLAERQGEAERPDLPALVAQAAQAGDALAAAALELWLGAYGSVAGDLALQTLCSGGLWVGGGTAAKLLAQLRSPAFLAAFGAKGRLSPVLKTIPLRALVDPAAGLFSAACRARTLMG